MGNGLCELFQAVLQSPWTQTFDVTDIGYSTVDKLTDAVIKDHENPDFHGYVKLYQALTEIF